MYIKLLSMQILIITGFNHHVSDGLQYTGVYLDQSEKYRDLTEVEYIFVGCVILRVNVSLMATLAPHLKNNTHIAFRNPKIWSES